MPEVKFIYYRPQKITRDFQKYLNLFSPYKFTKLHGIKAIILTFSIRNFFSPLQYLP